MSAYPTVQPYPAPAPNSGNPYPTEHQTYPNSHYGPPASYGQTSAYPPAGGAAYPPPNAGYPAPAPAAYPAPVVQQTIVGPPPPVAPLFIVDSQRKATHQPGVLVYSAKFSEQKLSCLYCIQTCPFCMECCGSSREMAKLTHLDVYTHGVLFSKPDFWAHSCDGCCGQNSLGIMRYYDHPIFNQTVTSDGLCYGGFWAMCACQGSFGEQITFMNSCCQNCMCNRSKLNHFIGCCNCCGINETIFGLKEDEGRRLAAIINEQASIFRANPNQYRLDPLVANGVDTKYV